MTVDPVQFSILKKMKVGRKIKKVKNYFLQVHLKNAFQGS
jgi:hypothetical protein